MNTVDEPLANLIRVVGASENNLRDVSIDVDRGQITVVTGVSGSGKSSLAFDTILAEAHRRFFYTLSHYSRQFLDISSRPKVRAVSGLSPAIALAQNETLASRRATVGTLTDIHELMGVLFARFGKQSCPRHGLATRARLVEDICQQLCQTKANQTVAILALVAESKQGSFKKTLQNFAKLGFTRAYVDGEVVTIDRNLSLARHEKHTIKVVIDVVKVKPQTQARLTRAIQAVVEHGGGYGEVCAAANADPDFENAEGFSTHAGCPVCGYAWSQLDSRHFAINSLGRCQECDGYGVLEDQSSVFAEEGALRDRLSLDPLCATCQGTGLRADVGAIRIDGRSMHDWLLTPLTELVLYLDGAKGELSGNPAARRVLEELTASVDRLVGIGLGYISASRRIRSLSSGEGQRVRLAGVLAGRLRGVLYVLDEPSQGLHATEVDQLWGALAALKRRGNTLIVVDHDEELMRRADWIIDFGPGGGAQGGRVVGKFRPKDAAKFAQASATAASLAMTKRQTSSRTDRPSQQKESVIRIKKARARNLKVEQVDFPIGALTVVNGVSGSGKSSLVLATLYANVAAKLADKKWRWRSCSSIEGWQKIENISLVDRRPLAKSSVSMPVSYLKVFPILRDLFAKLPDAQITGLVAKDFSINSEGGRCTECNGRGEITLTMRFLSDQRVPCPVCRGARFQPHVLEIRYNGLSVADVLNLTIEQAIDCFKNHKRILRLLQPAARIGLGYLKLGQPTASLSGGEAQRLKLVPFLSRMDVAGQLLVLDEPTTGLHGEDIKKLLAIFRNLVDRGATLVVIEHHAAVREIADQVLEMGPGASSQGGQLVRSISRASRATKKKKQSQAENEFH